MCHTYIFVSCGETPQGKEFIMKDIITILSHVVDYREIGIYKLRGGGVKIIAYITVNAKEDSQEILNKIEEMGGKLCIVYNINGNIGLYVTFNTSDSESEYVKVAKLINLYLLENRFVCKREALMKYCEGIDNWLNASK